MTATATTVPQDAGKTLQRDMLAKYYGALETANEKGEPVAYLFIPGNIVELTRCFDFHAVYPEINALQCGIKKVAGDNIVRAEDLGYSSDVCGYVKNDVGLMLADRQSPFGKIPKPDLLVCNYSGCNTFIKWFEALAHFYGSEFFLLDIPYIRGRAVMESDVAYVVAQLEELIDVCERRTGVTFSEAKLRETLEYSRQAEDLWVEILNLAQERPSPFDSYFEAVFYMAPINILRGTPETVEYYRQVLREMRARVDEGHGPVPEEKFRVVIEGPPPWPDFRAEFVNELGIPTLMVESDLADPRYFQEAQLRNRIDAFFESLQQRRLTGAVA